ncbi:MAG: hypothetical protein ACOC93_01080 [Planctomycetota bacterium]
MERLPKIAAGLGFFALAAAAAAAGASPWECCSRALLGAVLLYLVLRIGLYAAMRTMTEVFADMSANGHVEDSSSDSRTE